jgi:uncharacterized protein (DUF1800 family)
LGAYRKGEDETRVVREHALGKFPDLLRASAHSPAMLAYLDNQVNERGVANENYARELMELHTLGVRGGYTQKDVAEVARCFTGWGIETRFLRAKGKFRFDPDRHDDGAKVVLGHRIPAGGGESDADQVLTILANHPQTARFVSARMCRHFIGEERDALIERTAETYRVSGGDIREMLRTLLLAPELLEAPPIAKRPLDFVVSGLRALNARTDGGKSLQEHLDRMGQPLYQWPMPDGYPERTSAWTSSLLARWNFAIALGEGRVKGTDLDLKDLLARIDGSGPHDKLATVTHGKSSGPLVTTLAKHAAEPRRVAALCLAAPEFQWR